MTNVTTERILSLMDTGTVLLPPIEMWNTIGAVFTNTLGGHFYTTLMCFIIFSSILVAHLMQKKHKKLLRSRKSEKLNHPFNGNKSSIKKETQSTITPPSSERYTPRSGGKSAEHPFCVLLGEEGWRAPDFIEAEIWFDNPTVRKWVATTATSTRGRCKAKEVLEVKGPALATLTTKTGEGVPVAGQWSLHIPMSRIGDPTRFLYRSSEAKLAIQNFLHKTCVENVPEVSLLDVLLSTEKLHTVRIALNNRGHLKEVSAEIENWKVTTTFRSR